MAINEPSTSGLMDIIDADGPNKLIYNSLSHLGFESCIKRTLNSWTDHSTKWIDAALCNHHLNRVIRDSGIVHIPESDHMMLFCVMEGNREKLRKFNWAKLRARVQQMNLMFLKTECTTSTGKNNCFPQSSSSYFFSLTFSNHYSLYLSERLLESRNSIALFFSIFLLLMVPSFIKPSSASCIFVTSIDLSFGDF